MLKNGVPMGCPAGGKRGVPSVLPGKPLRDRLAELPRTMEATGRSSFPAVGYELDPSVGSAVEVAVMIAANDFVHLAQGADTEGSVEQMFASGDRGGLALGWLGVERTAR